MIKGHLDGPSSSSLCQEASKQGEQGQDAGTPAVHRGQSWAHVCSPAPLPCIHGVSQTRAMEPEYGSDADPTSVLTAGWTLGKEASVSSSTQWTL